MKISIILPVVNEENLLGQTLEHLKQLDVFEVIVVDGGSLDGTCQIVEQFYPQKVRLIQTGRRERAFQMNAGAFAALGDILLFVHADMNLPDSAVSRIQDAIQKGYAGGGFKKQYVPSNFLMRVYATILNELYLGWMRCLVGTNAMFVKREIFLKMKGFADVSFLEDVMFAQCLKKFGKVAVVSDPVHVSSRRYFENGILRQIIKNMWIMCRYQWLHKNPDDLGEIY